MTALFIMGGVCNEKKIVQDSKHGIMCVNGICNSTNINPY